MNKQSLFLMFFITFSTANSAQNPGGGNPNGGNPFGPVKERYEWAIEQVMGHKRPDDSSAHMEVEENGKVSPVHKVPYQVKTYKFQAETDKARINVTVTAMEEGFIIDAISDQAIQGWLLKRQSTRAVFLKGGASDNPYEVRIRVDRPYIKDFGLTLFVTRESDPAFIQLY